MSNSILAIFIGFVILFLGTILYYFPPKKDNKLDGYQSPSLSANPQIWKKVQKYYARNIIYFGIAYTMFSGSLSYFFPNFPLIVFSVAAFIFLTIIQFFLVERKIKNLLENSN